MWKEEMREEEAKDYITGEKSIVDTKRTWSIQMLPTMILCTVITTLHHV